VKIPSQNNQVGLIVGDVDVHAFYGKLHEKYVKALRKEDAETLTELVDEGAPNPNDDIDF